MIDSKDITTQRYAVPQTISDRTLAIWEILSVMSSAFIAEWMYAATAGLARLMVAIPTTLALLLILSSQRLRKESLREIGLRFDNFLRAVRLLLLPLIVAALLALAIGFMFGGRPNFLRWHAERPLVTQLAISTGWGFVQQYVLQSYINRRAQIIWGAGKVSVLVTAILFAVLHLPNPALVIATLVGGAIWAAIYQRAPNLFALALSHSLMSWVIASTLPESILSHARVGIRYFF